ncbi:MAG: glycosyltransferase [Chloroflexi bacterium]|nr:glycosyltransferase [Chloroflexota bacterium]
MIEISVVVMTYNEAATLAETTREILEVLTSLNLPHDILIVDDGSADGSREIADQLASAHPAVRAIHHPTNQGLGGVYRSGFAQAQGQVISFFPADGQFPAAILAEFYSHMASADLVLGYLPQREASIISKSLSFLERLLYRLLFGHLPRFQGVLMFRRALLEGILLRSQGRGWAVLLEFILRSVRRGCRVVSLPTALRPRRSGRSKVNNLRTIASNLQQAFQLHRILRDE